MQNEQKMDERYLKQLGQMRAPIPGQSLTNDPNSPLPFEGPPVFTKKKEATEEIFTNLIREDVYPMVIDALADGVPVMDLTKVLLFEGFREGKWNPDLFLLLIEPTAYMVMALAERAEIDFRIDNDPDPDEEVAASQVEKKFEMVKKSIQGSKVKSGVIPKEIEKQIEELPVESLLSKPNKKAIVQTEESLLAKEAQVEEEEYGG